MEQFESSDRRPAEYLLFALGFTGFMLAGAGIVLSSVALAVFGGFLFLGVTIAFLAGH